MPETKSKLLWSNFQCNRLDVTGLTSSAATAISALSSQLPLAAAHDEAEWRTIQQSFPVDCSIVSLNHAGMGASSRAVMDSVIRHM